MKIPISSTSSNYKIQNRILQSFYCLDASSQPLDEFSLTQTFGLGGGGFDSSESRAATRKSMFFLLSFHSLAYSTVNISVFFLRIFFGKTIDTKLLSNGTKHNGTVALPGAVFSLMDRYERCRLQTVTDGTVTYDQLRCRQSAEV